MSDKKLIIEVNQLLYKATKPIRIMSHISWDENVRNQFFANKCKQLPQVEYMAFDPKEVFVLLQTNKTKNQRFRHYQ